ncbi:MAG: antirestriction protein ArdA [Faecalibacterium sp.]|jgi:hypothetical protein|nr:antirestriction protein ArdA [Faecalibacterium sp.]
MMLVYLGNPNSEAYVNLALPATAWELLDVQDRLRLEDGVKPYWEISEYFGFESLASILTEDCDLNELNALTETLSKLNKGQRMAFEGLVQMDVDKKDGVITVPRLIDLAASADCCHILPEVITDEELGRFYADNGFLPELEHLPDNLYNALDYGKIGHEQRTAEGGVFTDGGYVVQHSDLAEVHQNMDFTLETPDYQILMETADGQKIKLPTEEPLPESFSRCLDCRIPALSAVIEREPDADHINFFAQQLSEIKGSMPFTFKAMLENMPCETLEQAEQYLEQIDHFMLDRKVASVRDLALSEINFMVGGGEEAELLAKYTDLYAYGNAILQRDSAVISGYGHLVRDDYQPLMSPLESTSTEEMEIKMQ